MSSKLTQNHILQQLTKSKSLNSSDLPEFARMVKQCHNDQNLYDNYEDGDEDEDDGYNQLLLQENISQSTYSQCQESQTDEQLFRKYI
jgi:hypothetical protein